MYFFHILLANKENRITKFLKDIEITMTFYYVFERKKSKVRYRFGSLFWKKPLLLRCCSIFALIYLLSAQWCQSSLEGATNLSLVKKAIAYISTAEFNIVPFFGCFGCTVACFPPEKLFSLLCREKQLVQKSTKAYHYYYLL